MIRLDRIAILVVGVLTLSWLVNRNDQGSPKSGINSPISRVAGSTDLASRARDLMPQAQRRLVYAVETGRERYKSGVNDMAKGASRPTRAKEICSGGADYKAVNWVGQVYSLSSNSDGLGVLSLEIAKDIYIKTWNNSVSDISDHTLIQPDTEMFSSASSLKKGQWVVFSATVLQSSVDCFKESSLSISGSMQEPEFIARFGAIRPLNM